MRLTFQGSAISAALLCGAILIAACPALAEGGGDPAVIQQIVEELQGKSDDKIKDILAELRGQRGPRSKEDSIYLGLVRAELKRRKELRDQAASPATPAPTPLTPPSQTSATPLAPPTATTPPPSASSGDCGQTGATCAEEETRQRQARKAETKRAQAAAADWAKQQGITR